MSLSSGQPLKRTNCYMLVGSLQGGITIASHSIHFGLKIGSTRQIIEQRQLSA